MSQSKPYEWSLANKNDLKNDLWFEIEIDLDRPVWLFFTTGDNWIALGYKNGSESFLAEMCRDETDLLVFKGLETRLYTIEATDIDAAKTEARKYFDAFWNESVIYSNYTEL